MRLDGYLSTRCLLAISLSVVVGCEVQAPDARPRPDRVLLAPGNEGEVIGNIWQNGALYDAYVLVRPADNATMNRLADDFPPQGVQIWTGPFTPGGTDRGAWGVEFFDPRATNSVEGPWPTTM